MYPRIHDKGLDPAKWLENYVMTYVERDIRSLANLENLQLFEVFLKNSGRSFPSVIGYIHVSGKYRSLFKWAY